MPGNISRLYWWIYWFGKYGSNSICQSWYEQFQFYCEHYQSGKDNTNETSTITGKLTTEEVAQKVIPSVVCIQAYSNTNGYFGTSSESGEGSGIIASSDGYIITNAHVIEGASALKVILSNGTSYEAKIVGSDTATDLALIKIDATDLQAAEFGSSEDLQVGEQVIAIGNPGGIQFNSSVTVGYVSAVNRSITYNGYDMECIQTDAAINPGNPVALW